jgi:two-component system chemotaxis response regulator CheY
MREGKRVLDVGNCAPDHVAIRSMLEGNFSAEVQQAHGLDDTLAALRAAPFDLVLVNRKLDQDYSDGLRVIQAIKSASDLRSIPVMMVTNYADHQQEAVDAGAEPGFGKLQLSDPKTVAQLQRFLSSPG